MTDTILIEPFGGLAGDMLLAALLDLGDARFGAGDLRALAARLVPGECSLEVAPARRGGIAGTHVAVRTAESAHPPHRHLADLERLVGGSGLAPRAAARALAAVRRSAVAEGAVHGIPPEDVHFHEVGAVDTIVDVCGAALALERLGVARLYCTPPLTGEGFVDCAHGRMPVPPPAVAEILRGRELVRGGGAGERLTPTGAAILREWCEPLPADLALRAEAVGYGAGTRDPQDGPPNLVRVQLGTLAVGTSDARRAVAWRLEVNLDDVTGEELGWLVAGLRAAGALDVWTTPVQMKKERPGALVAALCRADARAGLEAVVLERSPTLGLRWSAVERTECGREELAVEVLGRRVRVKRRLRPDYPGRSPDGARDLSPEHDDLVAGAEATGRDLRELERLAIELALEELARRRGAGGA